MSVHVQIDIAPQGFRTWRTLEINRIETAEAGDRHTYEVTLGGPTKANARPRATFNHSFHDDALALITEAIAALREAGVTQA